MHAHIQRMHPETTHFFLCVCVCVCHMAGPQLQGSGRRAVSGAHIRRSPLEDDSRWFLGTPLSEGAMMDERGSGGPHCLFRPLVSDTVPAKKNRRWSVSVLKHYRSRLQSATRGFQPAEKPDCSPLWNPGLRPVQDQQWGAVDCGRLSSTLGVYERATDQA